MTMCIYISPNYLVKYMKIKKKNNKRSFTLVDYVKASRIGSREAEKEIKDPGFHSSNSVHRSKKTYTRKVKHKGSDL